MLNFNRNAIGVLVFGVVVLSARIELSEYREEVDSLDKRNGDDDLIYAEGDPSEQARDKRTIGLLLSGIGDLFGYDVQRRPSVVQNAPVAAPSALQVDPTLARQQAPPAAPPPGPAPGPAAPPAAPAGPPGIAPPLMAPVTLTDGVRRAFQVGVNWSNQRQQLGGAPPPAAGPPPGPAPAPAPAPPPAAAPPPPPGPPPPQGETRSLAVGLNWQNLRQQLGAPPGPAPAAPPPAAGAAPPPAAGAAPPPPPAPPGPPAPQGVRQSYQIGLDFTNQRQQLGGPPPGPPPPAGPAPAAAPPPPVVGASIANLGVRPFPPRFPSLLREKPLSLSLVERIYFNKEKPIQKNIYYKKDDDRNFDNSLPLSNTIAGSNYGITTPPSKPYALGDKKLHPPPRLDTPPNETEETDDDADSENNEEEDEEEREESKEETRQAPRGFGKTPPAKVYKVDTGDPNEETYVLEEDYAYGDKPKKVNIEFPDYLEEEKTDNKRDIIKEIRKQHELWKSTPQTDKTRYKYIKPTPLTLIDELKNEKPIEIKYSGGEFQTSKHHRSVRSLDSPSLTYHDTSPSLTRSYAVHHDSTPAENIEAAKIINKKIINYYGEKFINDAITAHNAIQNQHLVNEPHYVLSPEQYQDPYSVYFKEEAGQKVLALPAPGIKQEVLTETPVPVRQFESVGVAIDDGQVDRYHQNALRSLVNTWEDLSRNPQPRKVIPNLQDDRVRHYHKNALKSILNTFQNNLEIFKEKNDNQLDDEEKKHKEKVLELVINTNEAVKKIDNDVKKIDEDVLTPLVKHFDKVTAKEDSHGDKDVAKHQQKISELLNEEDGSGKGSEEEKDDEHFVIPPANKFEDVYAHEYPRGDKDVAKHQQQILELINEDGANKGRDEEKYDEYHVIPPANKFENVDVKEDPHGDKDVAKHQQQILELLNEGGANKGRDEEKYDEYHVIPPANDFEDVYAQEYLRRDKDVAKHQQQGLELLNEGDGANKGREEEKDDEDFEAPPVNKFEEVYYAKDPHGDKDVTKHQQHILELLKEVNEVDKGTEDESNGKVKIEKEDEKPTISNVDTEEDEPTKSNVDTENEDDETIKVGNDDIVGQNDELNDAEKEETDKKLALNVENNEENLQSLKLDNKDIPNENVEQNEREDDKEIFDYEYFAKPYELVEEIEKVIYPNNIQKINAEYEKTDRNHEDETKLEEEQNAVKINYDEAAKKDPEENDDETDEKNVQEKVVAEDEIEEEEDDDNENNIDKSKDEALKEEETEDEESEKENNSGKTEKRVETEQPQEKEENEDEAESEGDDEESANEQKKLNEKAQDEAKKNEITRLQEEEKQRKLKENEKQIKKYIEEHFEVDEINGVSVPKAVKDTDRYNQIVKNTKEEDIDKFSYFPHHEYEFKELDGFFGKDFDANLKELDHVQNKVEDLNKSKDTSNQEDDAEEEAEEEADEESEDEESDEDKETSEKSENEQIVEKDDESKEASKSDEAEKASEDDEESENTEANEESDEEEEEEASKASVTESNKENEDDEESDDAEENNDDEESEVNKESEEEAEPTDKEEKAELTTPAKEQDILQYPHEQKFKDIYSQFQEKLAINNPDTQDSNTLEVIQSPLHSGGFKSGGIEVIDNPEKVVTVPYDYDYSGSEKKIVVSSSPLEDTDTHLKRTRRGVLDFFEKANTERVDEKASKLVKRQADDYAWSYVPEKYDPSFTYQIPEPNIPDLKKYDVKEHKDDDQLSPFAFITESETGRKKTYIKVNQKQMES